MPCLIAPVVDPNEESPRGIRTGHGEPSDAVALIGKIALRDPAGLSGQVIINGSNLAESASSLWKGIVTVGDPEDGTPPLVTLGLDPLLPASDRGPYYARPSNTVGGGAVGLAPFHLYENDCQPPHDPLGTSAGVTEPEINGFTVPSPVLAPSNVLLISFYGPIKKATGAPWSTQIKVRARPFPPGCQGCVGCTPTGDPLTPGSPACNWTDVSSAFHVYGPGVNGPDGQPWPYPRAIGLKLKNGYYAAPGIYMVNPVAADSVRCKHVDGEPAVVWPGVCANDQAIPQSAFGAMGYGFVISGDCDEDGVMDQFDCALTGPGCSTNCDVADFNNSGQVTVQDIFDFLTAYFGNCTGGEDPPCYGANADVNNSGTVSVQDIFDFLAAYFGAANC